VCARKETNFAADVSNRVWSATVETRPRLRIEEPRAVSDDLTEFFRSFRGAMDRLPDGRMIAIVAGDDEAPPTEVKIVLNWFRELEARMASAR
jgi:hypothetical protein